MKKFFLQDKVIVGILAGLGSEFGFIIALTIGLIVAGEAVVDHLRWYGGMFIPLILVLRHYAKGQSHLRVVKTLIVVFFLTFLAFIFYILRSRVIVFQ